MKNEELPLSSLNTLSRGQTQSATPSCSRPLYHRSYSLVSTKPNPPSPALPWVSPSLSPTLNLTQDTLTRPTNSKFFKLFVLIFVLGFPFLVQGFKFWFRVSIFDFGFKWNFLRDQLHGIMILCCFLSGTKQPLSQSHLELSQSPQLGLSSR